MYNYLIISKKNYKMKRFLTPLSLSALSRFPGNGNGNKFPFKKIYKINIYIQFYGN